MTQIATVTPVIQNVTITTPSETVTIQAHVRDNVTVSTDTMFVAPPGGTGTVTQVNTGTGITGGPFTTTGTVALEALSSNPSGTYQHATILVDQYGRVTGASSGTDNAGVTSVLGGNHLTQSVAGSVVTVNHDSPGASLSSSQFVESINVDAYGHVTGVTESANQAAARTFLGLGAASTKAIGTTAGTVAAGDDARFTDARNPLPHNQTLSTITDSGSAAALDVPSSGDAAAGQVVKGNDSRLNNARTPTTTLDHDADKITSGTLAVARGGTGSATAPMVGVITAADATAARTVLSAAATNHNHAAGSITSGTLDNARVAESNVTQHAAAINLGNLGNVNLGLVTNDMFVAYNQSSSQFTGRSPAAARTAMGAQATLTAPVTSPSMTGVSSGSITGVIKCSQSQYDAITPDANTLYVIV